MTAKTREDELKEELMELNVGCKKRWKEQDSANGIFESLVDLYDAVDVSKRMKIKGVVEDIK